MLRKFLLLSLLLFGLIGVWALLYTLIEDVVISAVVLGAVLVLMLFALAQEPYSLS